MREARIVFRPEGIKYPTYDQRRSINFLITSDARPSAAADCAPYEEPIRIWLDRAPTEIWFSRPEHLYWAPGKSRDGQDTLVEGGLTLASGHRYRFRLELHASFCNCAWCQDEPCVADEHVEHISLDHEIGDLASLIDVADGEQP